MLGSAVLAVRAGPQDATWHLVDGRPLDAAICGAPRPRRGWWDLGPQEWAPAANTCGACLAAHDRRDCMKYQCPVCGAVWGAHVEISLHLISIHHWRTMAVVQWLRRVEEAQS